MPHGDQGLFDGVNGAGTIEFGGLFFTVTGVQVSYVKPMIMSSSHYGIIMIL
jgi:hypothetical protein